MNKSYYYYYYYNFIPVFLFEEMQCRFTRMGNSRECKRLCLKQELISLSQILWKEFKTCSNDGTKNRLTWQKCESISEVQTILKKET